METIKIINNVLDKGILIRSYYDYKKKLYDKDIFQTLKNSIYNNQAMRCLLLEFEDTDRDESKRTDKLISEQLPNRKDIFHDTDKQKVEMEKTNETTNSMINKFKEKLDKPVQIYNSISENTTIKEEFIKCGKENCYDCPHGPYFYAYWRDKVSKKLKKKYLGNTNPRDN